MDREPPVPGRGTEGEDAPDLELLAAVERASRHVSTAEGLGRGRPVVRFDAPRADARRVRVLSVILAVSIVLAALLTLAPPRAQSTAEVEADLRWAVANVVREVEAERARTGALPFPERLEALLGRQLRYEPMGDAFVVTGERDGVRVRWDSRDAARPPQDGP